MHLPLLCGTTGLLAASLSGAPCPKVAPPCAQSLPPYGAMKVGALDSQFIIEPADNRDTEIALPIMIGADVKIDAVIGMPSSQGKTIR